jgi:hypothetical protein
MTVKKYTPDEFVSILKKYDEEQNLKSKESFAFKMDFNLHIETINGYPQICVQCDQLTKSDSDGYVLMVSLENLLSDYLEIVRTNKSNVNWHDTLASLEYDGLKKLSLAMRTIADDADRVAEGILKPST